MMPVRIRPMRDQDVAAVQAIDRLAFAVPWPENAYAHELHHSPHSRLWVAEAEGAAERQIIGFAVLWLILDEAHIATIAVHPARRGQGIGKRLLETMIAAAADAGSRLITLEVRAGNHIAQGLYRAYGFRVVGRRPHYYNDNREDALIMTRYLDPPGKELPDEA